jgi:AraC-like DNA-binding protein
LGPLREKHTYDPLFPFVFLHFTGIPKNRESLPYHFHDWYEIVFVHDGEGKFFIDKKWYRMQKGDLYTIAGNIIHKATPTPTFPYICSVILFHPMLINSRKLGDFCDFLQPFAQARETEEYRYRLANDTLFRIEELLMEMNQELHGIQKGNRQAGLILLNRILLDLNRGQWPNSFVPVEKLSKSEMWMKDVLVYIDDCYSENNLSLARLANQALVSPEHFSRVFKQVTGFTLPAYLGAKRIFKSKELLIQTDHSISYIADVCGFKSVSYFHHIFKKNLGCTPETFRTRG